jgi:bifunctional DNA-binding transcriptional regulator/antitoxin component of YhaV-PrlF toxin-antitoxin module
LKATAKGIVTMANAYVIDSDSIKLPKEISEKLKLKEGMELKILSDDVDGVLIMKIIERKSKDFSDIKGVGKAIWESVDAQEYVNQERNEWN